MNIKDRVKFNSNGEAEWGGASQPTPGKYLGRYDEGIELVVNDETGARRIQIPVVVVDAGDNEGKKFYITVFLDGEAWMVERSFDQLCSILVTAKIDDYFEKTYNQYDSLFDEAILPRVVKDLQIRLSGRVAEFVTELQKGKDDKQFIRVKKIAPANTGSPTTTASTAKWDA